LLHRAPPNDEHRTDVHHRLVDVVSAGLGVLASKPVACMICPL